MRYVIIAAVLLLGGCPGELEDPERFAACGDGYVEDLFMTGCAGPGCHGSTNAAAALDLVSPGVEARLIGEPSVSEFCEGRLRVDPEADDPRDHLLLDKLEETPSCGARMPFGTAALDSEQKECLRRWVDELVNAGSEGEMQ